MTEREALTVTSRDRLRQEIAQQTELFLRTGGAIVRLHAPTVVSRPIGSVWWSARGTGGVLAQA